MTLVIAYYLRNREVVEEYLRRRAAEAGQLRALIEAQPDYQRFREHLLARQQQDEA